MLNMEEWMDIHLLSRQGHTIRSIARLTNLSRNTPSGERFGNTRISPTTPATVLPRSKRSSLTLRSDTTETRPSRALGKSFSFPALLLSSRRQADTRSSRENNEIFTD